MQQDVAQPLPRGCFETLGEVVFAVEHPGFLQVVQVHTDPLGLLKDGLDENCGLSGEHGWCRG